MNSMTGFGKAERRAGECSVSVQVSSVNRKNMEVVCALPRELQHLEREIAEASKRVARRGRFQFSVEISEEAGSSGGLPSDELLDAGIDKLKAIAQRHGGSSAIDARTIVELAGLLESEGNLLHGDAVGEALMECVSLALKELVAMRSTEGGALKNDLEDRCLNMKRILVAIGSAAPDMVDTHRKNLFTRLERAGLNLDLEDDRVLKEIALFADRCDISEETTRLESHFDQFADLLEKTEPVGRSLEFLVQEIAREINTIGSKSCSIAVSKLALELKNELERVREQVANVE